MTGRQNLKPKELKRANLAIGTTGGWYGETCAQA